MLFQLKILINSSSAQWYNSEWHQEGQSPYLYKYADDNSYWIKNNSHLHIKLGTQTETTNINKFSYTCNELNSNSFMDCMESYYSKKLGCLLPWSQQRIQENVTSNICRGREKFIEFRNLSMKILKPEEYKELVKEGCFTPNCCKRTWNVKFKDEFSDGIFGTGVEISQNTEILVRKEVNLYTPINFFAEVGGYLGLLLGESLISYIIVISKWVHGIGKKMKDICRKNAKEPGRNPV